MDLDTIYRDLRENFYVKVPFNVEEKAFDKAIEAYFAFLQLPEPIRCHIQGTIAPQHRRGDIGFTHRDPGENIYNDSKDFFHYHPVIYERYADFLKKNPIVHQFIDCAKPIWERADETVKQVLRTLNQKFPGVYSKVFDCEHPHLMVRFLRYNWQNSGKYLAKPHFDAGSFTLAIAESCPGLRIGSCPENLKAIEQSPEQAIFMLSSNFQKLMTCNELLPGWHDVVQVDEKLIGRPFARWAIVCFIEGHSVEALPRSETHKWMPQA